MTISHDGPIISDGAFVFARLANVSCSICAPVEMTQDDVEAFATANVGGEPPMGGWEAVDKSKVPGFGSATPNPCNKAPGRRHWFLLAGLQAAAMGLPTKK